MNSKNGSLKERYQRDGFVKIEGLLSLDEVEQLKEEARQICAGRRGEVEGLEPLDEGVEPDDSIVARYLAIHFPHKLSPLVLDVVKHERIAAVLTQLVSPDVKCMQSMMFMKHAGKPGQAWHQDEFYIHTRDRSLCGVWIAMDPATRENGCLWIIPGSHQPGILWPMKPHESDEFDAGEVSYGWPFDEKKDAIPVEVDPGGVVFFNGYTLHCSHRNQTRQGFRRALVNHCMDARSWLPWRWDTRLAMKEDMRDIVMVAGKDPYEYKGTEDLNVPYVRPERPEDRPTA